MSPNLFTLLPSDPKLAISPHLFNRFVLRFDCRREVIFELKYRVDLLLEFVSIKSYTLLNHLSACLKCRVVHFVLKLILKLFTHIVHFQKHVRLQAVRLKRLLELFSQVSHLEKLFVWRQLITTLLQKTEVL